MDIRRKSYGQWRPVHTKVKIGNLYKKLKKPAKLLKKALGSLCRIFCSTAAPRPAPAPAPAPGQHYRDDKLAFMSCILKVKTGKQGWQTSIVALLKNCKGVRFQMDQNGRVEVNGIADPDKLMRKIGKSSKVELQWMQFGQCSSNLFLPPETKKDPVQETKKDPVQEKPKHNNNVNPPLPSRPGYDQYGYGYPYYPQPQPRIFWHHLPPYN